MALGLIGALAFALQAQAQDAPNPKDARLRPRLVGADISWVQQQEEEGIRFSDGGKPEDIFVILKRHGFNAVRLRVFVNPKKPKGYSAEGYCGLLHTMEMAKRIKAAKMRFTLDLHYSDTWADPAHQTKPADWVNMGPRTLRRTVYKYTHDVMAALKAQRTSPDIVQIGNEINSGMLWPDGEMWKPGRERTFCNLLKSAIAAAREVSPTTRIMLHTATGGRNGDCRAFLSVLARNKVDFDILGVSYYPKYDGGPNSLRFNLNDLARRYPQDIIVAEYTAPDQNAVHDIVWGLPNGKGLGTFIWEPTRWPMGNPALFDRSGQARVALRDFDSYLRKAELAQRSNAAPSSNRETLKGERLRVSMNRRQGADRR